MMNKKDRSEQEPSFFHHLHKVVPYFESMLFHNE